MNGIAVDKLKAVLTAVFQVGDRYSQFLLALPYSAGLRAFTVLNFTARTIDLALSQAGFLVYQQNLAITDHKHQRCRIFSLPAIPVNIRKPIHDDGLPIHLLSFVPITHQTLFCHTHITGEHRFVIFRNGRHEFI